MLAERVGRLKKGEDGRQGEVRKSLDGLALSFLHLLKKEPSWAETIRH